MHWIWQVAFNEAKLRPPTDLMDLKEFLEAMGKLESYRRGGWMSFKGPILYSKLSSSMQHVGVIVCIQLSINNICIVGILTD